MYNASCSWDFAPLPKVPWFFIWFLSAQRLSSTCAYYYSTCMRRCKHGVSTHSTKHCNRFACFEIEWTCYFGNCKKATEDRVLAYLGWQLVRFLKICQCYSDHILTMSVACSRWQCFVISLQLRIWVKGLVFTIQRVERAMLRWR